MGMLEGRVQFDNRGGVFVGITMGFDLFYKDGVLDPLVSEWVISHALSPDKKILYFTDHDGDLHVRSAVTPFTPLVGSPVRVKKIDRFADEESDSDEERDHDSDGEVLEQVCLSDVIVSPCGRWVACTVSYGGQVNLFHANGQHLCEIEDTWVYYHGDVSFSPCGNYLAISNWEGMPCIVWDILNHKEHLNLTQDRTSLVSWGKTGIAVYKDNQILLYKDPNNWRVLVNLPESTHCSSLEWSPDGNTLAILGDGLFFQFLFDENGHEIRRETTIVSKELYKINWGPNGNLIFLAPHIIHQDTLRVEAI